MSKYEPLTVHLRGSDQTSVTMTFAAIERIVGAKLPPSAYKYRAWWSNNPTNSVITHAWLDAGYKTANVDMPGRKLVFRKFLPDEPSTEIVDGRHVQDNAAEAVAAWVFSRVFGALKGTVTVAPGTDLTSPIGEDWDAAR